MPKEGRKRSHRGRVRQYTSPKDIDAQLQAERQKANVSCPFLKQEEDEQEEGGMGLQVTPKRRSLETQIKVKMKMVTTSRSGKVWKGSLTLSTPTGWHRQLRGSHNWIWMESQELSRREREEIEKQKAKERHMKMHLAGRTEQAKAAISQLAIIRKEQEEAARKKEESKR